MARKKARRISKPQPEQNVMYFISENANMVLDLSAALTAVNRKQYHQTKGMKPLAYHVRAQCITTGSDADPIFFSTAPNTWTTRNAVSMLGSQFKKQLRENGIRISQLPTYGRELRLALQTGVGYTHGSGSDGFGTASLLNTGANKVYHALLPDGSEVFTDYTNTDGATVSYETANELTLISIPETAADGEPETVVCSLIGTSDHDANDFAVIPEYLGARRNAHDHVERDHDFPEDTNLMMRIGAVANEHFDDVVDAIEDVGDLRPYNETGANTLMLQGILGAVGDYTSFVAPLGLIKVQGNSDARFLLTVTAITEM